MTGELTFDFEEMPLIVEGGFEAGLVNGSATIRYHADGEWSVGEIFLEGYRERPKAERDAMEAATGKAAPRFERKNIEVDRPSQIYLAVMDRLETGSYRDQVQEKVNFELADAGISPRSDFAEHNTLNRAQQGVA